MGERAHFRGPAQGCKRAHGQGMVAAAHHFLRIEMAFGREGFRSKAPRAGKGTFAAANAVTRKGQCSKVFDAGGSGGAWAGFVKRGHFTGLLFRNLD